MTPDGTGGFQPWSQRGDWPARSVTPAPVKKVRTHHLRQMKQRGERFTELTSYEMDTARIFDDAGVDALLIGDCAANNAHGNPTSLPVTVDELIPLARAVLPHDRAAGVVHERRRSGTDSRVAPVRQGDDNRLEA